jgi:hypothetical protein
MFVKATNTRAWGARSRNRARSPKQVKLVDTDQCGLTSTDVI